jgi:hypothetical protein
MDDFSENKPTNDVRVTPNALEFQGVFLKSTGILIRVIP